MSAQTDELQTLQAELQELKADLMSLQDTLKTLREEYALDGVIDDDEQAEIDELEDFIRHMQAQRDELEAEIAQEEEDEEEGGGLSDVIGGALGDALDTAKEWVDTSIDSAKKALDDVGLTSANPSESPVIAGGIKAKVGKGGKNDPDDVRIVQYLLVKAGKTVGTSGPNGDGVDGDCGSKTVKAIKSFQQDTFGWQDGLVQPGGQTWGALSGLSPPSPSDSSGTDDVHDDDPSDTKITDDPSSGSSTASQEDIEESIDRYGGINIALYITVKQVTGKTNKEWWEEINRLRDELGGKADADALDEERATKEKDLKKLRKDKKKGITVPEDKITELENRLKELNEQLKSLDDAIKKRANNYEFKNQAEPWAGNHGAFGLKAGALAKDTATPMSDDLAGLVRTILEKAEAQYGGEVPIANVAIFTHGPNSVSLRLPDGKKGAHTEKVEDFASVLRPALTADSKILLFACNVSGETKDGGASFSESLQVQTGAEVWGHTSNGHTTQNTNLAASDDIDGDGYPETATLAEALARRFVQHHTEPEKPDYAQFVAIDEKLRLSSWLGSVVRIEDNDKNSKQEKQQRRVFVEEIAMMGYDRVFELLTATSDPTAKDMLAQFPDHDQLDELVDGITLVRNKFKKESEKKAAKVKSEFKKL